MVDLHGVGRAPGQLGPFARAQPGQQRVRGQRVPERVPLRRGAVGGDQLGLDRGTQVPQQVRLLQPAHRPHDRQRETTAQHGRDVQQGRDLGSEPVDPVRDAEDHGHRHRCVPLAAHRPAVRVPHEPAHGDHAVQQLLDDERHAVAVAEQPVHRRAGHVVGRHAQAGRNELPHPLRVEATRLDDRDTRPPSAAPHQLPGRTGLGAGGRQQHDRLADEVVGEVVHDRQRLRVRVVQVLQDDQAPDVPAEHGEQPQQAFGDDEQRLVVAEGRGVAPFRQEPGQRRAVGHQLGVGGQPALAGQREQRLGDRSERRGRAARARPPPQHPHPARQRVLGRLGDQSGLPDPRLAEHEHRAAPLPRTVLHRGGEHARLRRAPDRPRRGDHYRRHASPGSRHPSVSTGRPRTTRTRGTGRTPTAV